MMLCDYLIKKHLDDVQSGLVINPRPNQEAMQPASVDLTLSSTYLKPSEFQCPDTQTRDVEYSTVENHCLLLLPGQFVLGCTKEVVMTPGHICARVEGKSSLGRMGLLVHCTAGFIDPGFAGQVTLEIKNIAPYPIQLISGTYIAQICFMLMAAPPERLYGSPGLNSRYQGQKGPVGAR